MIRTNLSYLNFVLLAIGLHRLKCNSVEPCITNLSPYIMQKHVCVHGKVAARALMPSSHVSLLLAALLCFPARVLPTLPCGRLLPFLTARARQLVNTSACNVLLTFSEKD